MLSPGLGSRNAEATTAPTTQTTTDPSPYSGPPFLVLQQGKDGINGSDGKDGTNGRDGRDGLTGPVGGRGEQELRDLKGLLDLKVTVTYLII